MGLFNGHMKIQFQSPKAGCDWELHDQSFLFSTHDSEAPSCGPAQIHVGIYHVWFGGMCFLAHAILAQAWLEQVAA